MNRRGFLKGLAGLCVVAVVPLTLSKSKHITQTMAYEPDYRQMYAWKQWHAVKVFNEYASKYGLTPTQTPLTDSLKRL